MKKNGLRISWLRFWHLRGFNVWKSWSGIGVVTCWPQKGWEEEIKTIFRLFEQHLPKDWVVDGPCWASGGAVVMYAWPKDDPRVQKRFANQDVPRPTADELNKSIEQIKGVKIYIGGKEYDITS